MAPLGLVKRLLVGGAPILSFGRNTSGLKNKYTIHYQSIQSHTEKKHTCVFTYICATLNLKNSFFIHPRIKSTRVLQLKKNMLSKTLESNILTCISDNINIIICRLSMLRSFTCNKKNLTFLFKFTILNEFNMHGYLI